MELSSVSQSPPPRDNGGTVLAARRLNRAAGTIAASVLVDSSMEHYRGAFENKAMYTPIATSALTLLASFHGHKDVALAGALGAGHRLRAGRTDWRRSGPPSISTT